MLPARTFPSNPRLCVQSIWTRYARPHKVDSGKNLAYACFLINCILKQSSFDIINESDFLKEDCGVQALVFDCYVVYFEAGFFEFFGDFGFGSA